MPTYYDVYQCLDADKDCHLSTDDEQEARSYAFKNHLTVYVVHYEEAGTELLQDYSEEDEGHDGPLHEQHHCPHCRYDYDCTEVNCDQPYEWQCQACWDAEEEIGHPWDEETDAQ